ncbi:MAG: hypothetical protein J6D47_18625 [Peptostreptococcaceae bacterium]|nr:hypothetical protein [Peptostreptococcaceae bacterium]
MNIAKIEGQFESIRGTRGNNAKQALLTELAYDKDFVKVLEFVYNDYKRTGIAEKKLNKDISVESYHIVNDLEELIDYIVKNNSGKDAYIKTVQDFIEKNKDHEDFIKEIITKAYKCGLNTSTINKVIPNLIPTFGVMLATKLDDCEKELKNSKGVIATLKLDGFRCTFIKSHGKAYSRQGIEIEGLVELMEDFDKLPSGVYDGELIAKGEFKEAKDQYKETSKIARKKGDKKGLKFVCFDYINESAFFSGIDYTPCWDRKLMLNAIIRNCKCEHIEFADVLYEGVYDEEKIMELTNILTDKGEEGLMLNIADAPYECKRTKTLIKIKKFYTCDLKVIGYTEGKGEMKGLLGSLIVDYKGNKLNVGSGFSLVQRKLYWDNIDELMGAIIEVGYREETSNENGDLSLRFPTFKRVRDDKSEVSYN